MIRVNQLAFIVFHEHFKHIKVDCHFNKDVVLAGKISTPYVSTDD